ncbi:hypothetical protein BJV78DRAFT_1176873 [Lactifluus subvellereus]|nr:hypothetical protein BJV78DRAFT_1176873 [Lactifluus subvellereus]
MTRHCGSSRTLALISCISEGFTLIYTHTGVAFKSCRWDKRDPIRASLTDGDETVYINPVVPHVKTTSLHLLTSQKTPHA